ncbi:hypothetical protein [Bacillus toyonensis]|uniref:hypothetical protein n=1 Tax=Bacillus toyonensis TaxID=155322 RepID=UPI0011AA242B|nr:hypothetical protein [Bacillus toyonensis]
MKKRIGFCISHNLFALANKAIREKSDIINLLLAALPEIMLESQSNDNNLGNCEVWIGKMSRIVFTLQNEESGQIYKKFSFSFPFQIEKQHDSEKITSWIIKDNNGIEINSQLISILQSLSQDNWFDEEISSSDEALTFYDNILQEIKNIGLDLTISDITVWHLIRKLFLFEPGYLRYDFDDNEERCDPKYHPLHHLDVFFSNKTTFKLGLVDDEIEKREWLSVGFENLLNSEEPCQYIKV